MPDQGLIQTPSILEMNPREHQLLGEGVKWLWDISGEHPQAKAER